MENSIGTLMHAYGKWRPREIPTIQSIMRNIVVPGLGYAPQSGKSQQETLDTIGAFSLYGLVDPERKAWREEIGRKIPPGETYQKAYLRVIKRLISYGEQQGLLHPDQYEITPEWRILIDHLQPLIGDYPCRKRSRLKSSFRKLARWATANNHEPKVIPLRAEDGYPMQEYKSTFSLGGDSCYYLARKAWNMVVEAHPELRLQVWEPEQVMRCRGVARDKWPKCLQDGIEKLFSREGLGGWSDETRSGYVSRIANYLGVLQDTSIPLGCFNEIDNGLDALRMLFQGGAAELLQDEINIYAHRLAGDSPFRQKVMANQRGFDGSFDGKTCAPNPFLVTAITRMVEENKIASAQSLLAKALAINKGILGVTDRHTVWLTQRIRLINKLSKKNPNAYTLKKRAVFRNPHLWADFVQSRSRLRENTLFLEQRVKDKPTNVTAQQRWAVALRNEVLFGILLCYPLRVTNLSEMQIGIHYDPSSYRIFFPAEEVKNGKEIDYELPDGGSLGDLQGLVKQYLDHARPMLLAGRQSPYFFVPNSRGGTRIPNKGFNLILADLSRRFFMDILPDGVDELNPHLLRHIAATYHLVIGGNLNLAAQILNDAPSTISQNYADILGYKKEATKRFLSSFQV